MFQILEAPTLLRLLDAAPEAVRHTIESGGWAGCLWPGHAEWEMHEACVQIRSLALHYFTVRHPAAAPQRRDTAAQLLGSQACPRGVKHTSAPSRSSTTPSSGCGPWPGGRRPPMPAAMMCRHPTPRPDTTAWRRCRGLYSSSPGAAGGAALCGQSGGPTGGGSLLAGPTPIPSPSAPHGSWTPSYGRTPRVG